MGLRVTLLSSAEAGPVEHPAPVDLTEAQRKVIFCCLNCHHLTHSPLAGDVPALECHAPTWHCHKQGQRSALRQLLKSLSEV